MSHVLMLSQLCQHMRWDEAMPQMSQTKQITTFSICGMTSLVPSKKKARPATASRAAPGSSLQPSTSHEEVAPPSLERLGRRNHE